MKLKPVPENLKQEDFDQFNYITDVRSAFNLLFNVFNEQNNCLDYLRERVQDLEDRGR